MNKVIFVMDYTFEEVQGGAELNTQSLAASLEKEGVQVVVVKCDEHGNVDYKDLKKKAEEHSENLAAYVCINTVGCE